MKSQILKVVALGLSFGMTGLPLACQEAVKIVGVGSGTCKQYLQEIEGNEATERAYLIWAQGYMSGILVRAPPGVDSSLNLTTPSFPVAKQALFLRSYCSSRSEMDFADAVQELYRTLRSPPG